MAKRILIGFVTIALLLAAAVFLIPVIFQKQISERIKAEINSSIAAKVDYSAPDISVFSGFPNITVTLNDVAVAGQQDFKGDTLLSMKSLGFSLNIMNIFYGKGYEITSLQLVQPVLKLRINHQGNANWNVIKREITFSNGTGSGTAVSDSGFLFQISSLKIKHAAVEYRNDSAQTFLSAEDLNVNDAQFANRSGSDISGSIDFTSASAFYSPDKAKQLKGALHVNIKFSGNKNDLDRKSYKLIKVSGYADVNDAVYTGSGLLSPLKIKEANFSFYPGYVSLDTLNARVGESDFNANGKLENVIPFLKHQGRLAATLNLKSDTIAIANFIKKNASTKANSTSQAAVTAKTDEKPSGGEGTDPSDILLTLNTQTGTVYYDKVILKGLSGMVEIDTNGFSFKGLVAKLSGGVLFINCHTNNFKNGIADAVFHLRANNMDIQKVYHLLDEAQKSEPWVQHISGTFSGEVDGSGKIKSDLSMVYNTVIAKGRLQIPDLKIDDMPVLTEIGRLAKVRSFDHLEAKNVSSVFSYKNGISAIDSTDIKFTRGDRIQFKGTSKSDQNIDADIGLEVPVKEFGTVASLAQNLLSSFMPLPENVKFVFKITGKNTEPKVTLVNMGTSGN